MDRYFIIKSGIVIIVDTDIPVTFIFRNCLPRPLLTGDATKEERLILIFPGQHNF